MLYGVGVDKKMVVFKRYEILDSYGEAVVDCMKKAQEENPERAKTWSAEELFHSAADFAGRHINISEE